MNLHTLLQKTPNIKVNRYDDVQVSQKKNYSTESLSLQTYMLELNQCKSVHIKTRTELEQTGTSWNHLERDGPKNKLTQINKKLIGVTVRATTEPNRIQ